MCHYLHGSIRTYRLGGFTLGYRASDSLLYLELYSLQSTIRCERIVKKIPNVGNRKYLQIQFPVCSVNEPIVIAMEKGAEETV